MSFSSGEDLGGYRIGISLLEFLHIFGLHFDRPRPLKKLVFWEAKTTPKIDFLGFWRVSVSDLNFSSFFFDFVGLGLGTFVKGF